MTTGKKFSLIVGEVADNNKGALAHQTASAPRAGLKALTRGFAVMRFLKLHESHFSFFSRRARDKSITPHHSIPPL